MFLRLLLLLALLALCPPVVAAQPDDPLPRPPVFPEWQPTCQTRWTLVTVDCVVVDRAQWVDLGVRRRVN
jgi:hypothetical protein